MIGPFKGKGPVNPTYLGWSVGTLGVSVLLNTQNIAVLFFFVTVLKIEPAIAGLLITASKIYDTVTDPLMGTISDRTRSRWGRRRPWLLIGGIACGVTFAALFMVPDGLSDTLTLIYAAATLVLLATAYTIFNVPYLAMPAEMVDGYHDRSVMMSYRVFFIGIGTYLATAVMPLVLAWMQEDAGMAARDAYGVVGLVIAALIAAAMLASFFGTRKANFTEAVASSEPSLKKIRMLLENRPFLIYLGIKLTSLFAIAANLAAKFFFITYVMQQSIGISIYFGTASVLGNLLSLPLWLWLSKRLGKRSLVIISSIFQILFTASWFFSGPDEALWVYALRGFLLGAGSTGSLLASQAMLPDVMEYDYRRTGLRREGVYAGLASFIEKLAFSLSGIIIGVFLSVMGFDAEAGAAGQSDDALFAIMACQAVLPIAMYAIKLALGLVYDLDEAKLKATIPPDAAAEAVSAAESEVPVAAR